jgi:hypothetical protein
LGLNTRLTPRQLPAAFATVAHNVLVSDGRIRPRAPWRSMLGEGQGFADEGVTVLSLFQWRTPDGLRTLVKTRRPGQPGALWAVHENGDLVALAGNLSGWAAQFLIVGDTCYVIDGSQRMVKVKNDMSVVSVGIGPPSKMHENPALLPTGLVGFGWEYEAASFQPVAGVLNGTFSYAVTYRDSTTGVESNPVYSLPVTCSGHAPQIFFNRSELPPALSGIDEVRIYRRNDTLSQPFYRYLGWDSVGGVVQEVDPFGADQVFVDRRLDSEISASDVSIGPFAPSRNGLPPRSRCAAWYNDRMFYAAIDKPGRLYYSELGYADHVATEESGEVDAPAFVNMTGGQSDGINGLLAKAGQLYVGQERGVQVLSGVIVAPDNLTRAVGTADFELAESPHQTFSTRSDVGPMETFGNNLVSAAGTLYFAAEAGLFAFDGDSSVNVSSQRIAPTWRDFVRRRLGVSSPAALITFAHDAQDGILYVASFRPGPSHYAESPPILAYHYATGAWTTLSEGVAPDVYSTVSCVASAIAEAETLQGDATALTRQCALLVGGMDGRVASSTDTDRDTVDGRDVPAAPFRWETGDLAVTPSVRKHFYAAKIHLHRTKAAFGSSPMVDLGYRLDGGNVQFRKTVSLVGAAPTRRVPIGRTGQDVRLVIRKSDAWERGWSPDAGIIGFELDVELVGQR